MSKSSEPNYDFHIAWEAWLNAVITSLSQAVSTKREANKTGYDQIHQLRASLKNTRALLRLAPSPYRRKARALRRKLSFISDTLAADRDQQVLHETLYSLDVLSSKSTKAETIATTSRFENSCRDITRIQKEIKNTFQAPKSLINIKKRARKEMKRERRRRPDNVLTATADELHRWRAALISRLLQGKFLHLTIGYPSTRKLYKFERLRNLLGEFNDLERAIASLRSARHKRRTIERAQNRQKNSRRDVFECLHDLK